VLAPTIRGYLNEVGVSGKCAYDFACGSGYFSALLSGLGASSVVGLDASTDLLDVAEQQLRSDSSAVRFRLADLALPQQLEQRDLVLGVFFLPYARSADELKVMVGNIAAGLKEGGCFLGALNNPAHPIVEVPTFDRTIVPVHRDRPLQEGDDLVVTKFRDGVEQTKVHIRWYPPERYEAVFEAAGFRFVEWLPLRADRALIPPDELAHWEAYAQAGEPAILRCIK
jgi:SAM-dependent methyltransferase